MYIYIFFITGKNDPETSVLASVLSQDRMLVLLSLTAAGESRKGCASHRWTHRALRKDSQRGPKSASVKSGSVYQDSKIFSTATRYIPYTGEIVYTAKYQFKL